MKKYLFYLALFCLGASIVVHLLAINGASSEDLPGYIWLLHIGVFAVLIPPSLELKKSEAYREFQDSDWRERMNPFAFFNLILKGAPTWIKILSATGFVYGFINGVYCILADHINDLQLFSGHWILFYCFSLGLIYKFCGSVPDSEN